MDIFNCIELLGSLAAISLVLANVVSFFRKRRVPLRAKYCMTDVRRAIWICNDSTVTVNNIRIEEIGSNIIADNKSPYHILGAGESFELAISFYESQGYVSDLKIKMTWDTKCRKNNMRKQELSII
jgi:hypothetical protein